MSGLVLFTYSHWRLCVPGRHTEDTPCSEAPLNATHVPLVTLSALKGKAQLMSAV